MEELGASRESGAEAPGARTMFDPACHHAVGTLQYTLQQVAPESTQAF